MNYYKPRKESILRYNKKQYERNKKQRIIDKHAPRLPARIVKKMVLKKDELEVDDINNLINKEYEKMGKSTGATSSRT